MARVNFIRKLYLQVKSERGDDAGSTRMLKAQLERLDGMQRRGQLNTSAASHFLIGSKARDEEAKLPPEDDEDHETR